MFWDVPLLVAPKQTRLYVPNVAIAAVNSEGTLAKHHVLPPRMSAIRDNAQVHAGARIHNPCKGGPLAVEGR